MIIIPGITRSGTSFLTRKIHEAGNKMYDIANEHYEDKTIHKIIRSYSVLQYGADYWYSLNQWEAIPKAIILNIDQYAEVRELKGFKNPRLIFLIEQLKQYYPDPKFIFCLRDRSDWLNSHHKRGRDEGWDLTLKSHYNFCLKQIESNKGFIFRYEKGHEKQHQKELMDYLGFKIDMSEWRTKSK